jgi:PAS domain S-box-containing protein
MSRFISGLRFRLMFLVLLALLPALGLTLATGLERRQLAGEKSKEEALRYAHLVASSNEALLEGARQLLVSLAQMPEIQSVDLGRCNLFLADLGKHLPNYTAISVALPDGQVFCSSIPLDGQVTAADRDYFQQALQKRDFVVGGFIFGRVSKKAVLPIAYPVINSSGQIRAVLIASLDLDWLHQLASQVQLPEDSSLLVVDPQGVILTRFPDPGIWVGKLLPEAEIIDAIRNRGGEGTIETTGVDGVMRLYAYTPISSRGEREAYVSIGIPIQVAYQDANRSLILNIIALGVVAALALAAAWFTGELFILRQVRQLVMASRRLAAGDLQARSEIPDGNGEISELARAFDGMAKELEEREGRLRQAEARYRSLVEQIPAITYLTSPQPSLDMIYVSPQAEAILGFTPEEWLQDPALWERQLHPEDYEKVKSKLQNARSDGQAYQEEYRFRTRDGKIIWLHDQASIVRDQAGKPLFVQGLILDISDQKRAEAELRRYAAQLERSNQELQDFAYIASHDLQEPLRKIQAFGERLVEKHGQELSLDGRDYAERMIKDAARMQSMINDLLSYSRVATKTQPFLPVYLNQVVREVVSDLEARLEETGGKVEVGDLPIIEGDALQLRQLFQNLIANALKFHKSGVQPVVKVDGKIAPFPDSIKGDLAEVTVADNGIGFDEKYLDRIFEPFQRLHGRGVYEGSGIGLAISRKIVERHNGVITAHSQPGNGAVFIVTLPVFQLEMKRDD